MNISIIGSHGVGKTELFESVMEELGSDFVRIEKIDLKEVEKSKDFFSFVLAQVGVIADRFSDIQWERDCGSDDFVCEGSFVSDVAYLIDGKFSNYEYAFPGHIKNNIDVLKNTSPVIMEAVDHFHDHDLLFYVPIEYDYGEHSYGEMPIKEFNHQREIDSIIRYLLEEYHITHRTIIGSLEERKETVLDTIKTIQNIGN